ncbi:MAG TPA: hypothetical protein VIJ01_13780 [Candidatus Angelobacter sp.]
MNRLASRDKLNGIPWLDILKPTKEAVPVARNAHISVLANFGSAYNAPCSAIKSQVIRAVKDRDFEMYFRNPQDSYRLVTFGPEALQVGVYPLWVPRREIDVFRIQGFV